MRQTTSRPRTLAASRRATARRNEEGGPQGPKANYLLGLMAGYLAMMSVTDPSMVVYSPVVALMGFTWLTQLPRTGITKTDVFMILWSLVTWTSASWSLSPVDTQVAVSTQIGTMALFLMIRALADRPKMLAMVAIGFLAGCLREVFVLYEAVGFSLESGFGEGRADLIGLNQNYIAYCLTVGLLLLVWLWGRTKRSSARVIIVAVAVACLLGINAAGTRAALLGIVALAVWLVVAHRVVKRKAMALLAGVAGTLAVLAYTGVADAQIGGQVQRSDRDTGHFNGRLDVWPMARDLMDQHPLAGIGAGAFRAMNPRGIDTHNAVLEVAVGTGLIGLALFALTLFYALMVSTRPLPFADRALYAGGLLVLLMPILLSGHWHQAPALWVVIAVVSSLARDPMVTLSSTPPDDVMTPPNAIAPLSSDRSSGMREPTGRMTRRVRPRTAASTRRGTWS